RAGELELLRGEAVPDQPVELEEGAAQGELGVDRHDRTEPDRKVLLAPRHARRRRIPDRRRLVVLEVGVVAVVQGGLLAQLAVQTPVGGAVLAERADRDEERVEVGVGPVERQREPEMEADRSRRLLDQRDAPPLGRRGRRERDRLLALGAERQRREPRLELRDEALRIAARDAEEQPAAREGLLVE